MYIYISDFSKSNLNNSSISNVFPAFDTISPTYEIKVNHSNNFVYHV